MIYGVMERISASLKKQAMNTAVAKIEQDFNYIIKYPEEFKECFKLLPKYKRDEIVKIINFANEMG